MATTPAITEEQIKEYGHVFRMFDTDGSGNIEPHELNRWGVVTGGGGTWLPMSCDVARSF